MAAKHISSSRALHQALCDYAALGWKVYPLMGVSSVGGDEFSDGRPRCECWEGDDCAVAGKHPALDGMGKTLAHAASSDLRVTLPAFFALDPRWEAEGPLFNVGLRTGPLSNVVIWDVDPRNGGAEGHAALEAQHGRFPITPQVKTGGGGYHYYLLYDLRLGADTRTEKFPGDGMGIDFFRGALAPIVMPPSMHRSLRRYEWVEGRSPADVPLAPCPEWIVQEVVDRDRARAEHKLAAAAARQQRGISEHPIQAAVDAYLDTHSPQYPTRRKECPVCGSATGFTRSSYSPLHWTCFSTRHSDLRVGFEVSGAWSGDVIDLHAHRTGLYDSKAPGRSRVAFLKAMGCL